MKKPKKIEEFHKFQEARSNCFRSFEKKFESTKDEGEALQKALDTARVNKGVLELSGRHYKGLKGEIIFYGKARQELDLDPLCEIKKTPADFFSPVSGKYYDVTTNLDYKDVDKYVRNDNREYEIASVDVKSEEIELIPTSFPVCPECGLYSHYIIFLDDSTKDPYMSFDYPSQDVLLFCWSCGYSKTVGTSDYGIADPISSVMYAMRADFEYIDEYSEEIRREIEEKANSLIEEEWVDIINSGRKEFDVFISAVTHLKAELVGPHKDDFETSEVTGYIHPILDLRRKKDRKFYFPDGYINR